MLYLQKGNFQKITRWMGGSWMSANQASGFGFAFVLLTGLAFYAGASFAPWRWLLLCIPFFLFMRMAMNTLDGLLSREYGTGSVAGEICNEGLDIVGDTIAYGALLFIPDPPYLQITLFLVLSWMAEYVGVLGKGVPGGIRRHETILGGKPDRAVWMGLLALLLFFLPGMRPHIGSYLLFVSFFVFLTSLVRIRKILAEARGKSYTSFTWIGK